MNAQRCQMRPRHVLSCVQKEVKLKYSPENAFYYLKPFAYGPLHKYWSCFSFPLVASWFPNVPIKYKQYNVEAPSDLIQRLDQNSLINSVKCV